VLPIPTSMVAPAAIPIPMPWRPPAMMPAAIAPPMVANMSVQPTAI
jgi:hypothetical protein